MLPVKKETTEQPGPAGTGSWVTVQQAGEETEAALVVGFLQSEGIPADSFDRSFHQTPTQTQELSEIEIAVPASRAADAEKVLAERAKAFLSAGTGETVLTGDGLVLIDVGSPEPEPGPGDEHSRLVAERLDDLAASVTPRQPHPKPTAESTSGLQTPAPETARHSFGVHRAKTVRGYISNHPGTSLLIFVTVGVLLGLFAGRRNWPIRSSPNLAPEPSKERGEPIV
ncbi:MAG: hypothetical protein L6R30_03300 [Thermoanaerobaculia bacterium]|nr:hypothetical protein [Thermoanaerobaculia bacterium]